MPSGIYKHPPQCGFQKGHKINLGRHFQIKDTSNMSGEKAASWKGDNAKPRAMHSWVVLKKGKASEHLCVDCGKQAQEWSNIDHSYLRILNDYSARCRKCHKKYDIKNNLS